MKRFALPLSLLIICLWAAFQPAEILSFSAPFLAMRKALTLLVGALALGWMGFSMLLALHPVWLERNLGGLDKLYNVHKWAGITSVLLVVTHWLIVLSPRTLAAWGWIELGARGGRPQHGGGFSLFGQAKEMGEWAAVLMIILGIVSILRFIPYNWFRKLHKGMPIAFLIGAFHGVVMLREAMWTPFGILVMLICLVGSVIAVVSLAGRIGRGNRHTGQISNVTATGSGVLDIYVKPGPDWPGHKAGQFALLTLDRKEGAHPFTIVSDWTPGGSLRFAIKSLGDFTRTLATRLKAGDPVVVEGPYGHFDFGDASEEQVWIAGGIGVAPFLARLEMLANTGGGNSGTKGKVHFFYCVKSSVDATFPEGLEDLCKWAGVELHLRIDDRDGLVKPGEIGEFVRKARSVWFCGPSGWGKSLRDAFCQYGLSRERFHQEIFEFR